MLDIKFIRENKDLVKQNCIDRRAKVDIDLVLSLDEERRNLLKQAEELRSLRNAKSKGKPTEEEIKKMREVGDTITKIEKDLAEVETKYLEEMMKIPNLTHPDSPIGEESDFKVIYKNFEPKEFSFKPLDHEELMLKNDLIDFERATKTTGTKFYFYKNNLVRLNQALLNYSMDIAAKYGYTLMETPDMAKNEIINGIGFNPRSDEETQIYSIKDTDLSLVGTAEITVGGYHTNEVLDLNDGPKKYIALSHCFRTEAGAYGKTSKGLYRVHQFTKLEMFVFCKPEDSEKYHAEILEIEKEILDGLEIPYQVIDIASADLGGPAYRKFDIEGYMVMKGDDKKQGDYGEITSCSNCTDYQARRLSIKYKKEDGSTAFVHTLNGTAVVLSRFPIILAENHQQKDGTIVVPKVLQKYCGLKKL
ncbi:MAG TPA: serine--tRNA ligase [Candidatus Magasanikbacteria bacterium]|nr:serine--tRNA ligase [Candidatus Magasanikbacteria bacterium]